MKKSVWLGLGLVLALGSLPALYFASESVDRRARLAEAAALAEAVAANHPKVQQRWEALGRPNYWAEDWVDGDFPTSIEEDLRVTSVEVLPREHPGYYAMVSPVFRQYRAPLQVNEGDPEVEKIGRALARELYSGRTIVVKRPLEDGRWVLLTFEPGRIHRAEQENEAELIREAKAMFADMKAAESLPKLEEVIATSGRDKRALKAAIGKILASTKTRLFRLKRITKPGPPNPGRTIPEVTVAEWQRPGGANPQGDGYMIAKKRQGRFELQVLSSDGISAVAASTRLIIDGRSYSLTWIGVLPPKGG